MKILAIETASDICGIAYIKNGKCEGLIEKSIPRKHAEQLPLFYQKLIKKTGLKLSELDGIAISIGPGSFTGLRIGLSYGIYWPKIIFTLNDNYIGNNLCPFLLLKNSLTCLQTI